MPQIPDDRVSARHQPPGPVPGAAGFDVWPALFGSALIARGLRPAPCRGRRSHCCHRRRVPAASCSRPFRFRQEARACCSKADVRISLSRSSQPVPNTGGCSSRSSGTRSGLRSRNAASRHGSIAIGSITTTCDAASRAGPACSAPVQQMTAQVLRHRRQASLLGRRIHSANRGNGKLNCRDAPESFLEIAESVERIAEPLRRTALTLGFKRHAGIRSAVTMPRCFLWFYQTR